MSAVSLIQKIVDRSMRRVRLMVLRGIIDTVDDSTKIQAVKVKLLDGMVSEGERFQQYGFTSVPRAGCEAIALAVGGNVDHLVVVAVEDRDRRTTELKEGETELYGPTGAHVRCREDGAIEVMADKVVIISGDINIGEESGAEPIAQAQKTNARLDAIENAINTHTHPTGTGPSGTAVPPLQPGQSVAAAKATVS